MPKFIISLLVTNQFGVLTRVSGMFSRRGFNIDSLTVGETEHPEFSRMTVTMTGDNYAKNQILKQLGKLHDVKEIKLMQFEQSVTRELILYKVRLTPATRQEIMDAVNVFRYKIIDYSPSVICIEATGESSKLNAFTELMNTYGIIEMCRTGVVSLDRGEECLKSN